MIQSIERGRCRAKSLSPNDSIEYGVLSPLQLEEQLVEPLPSPSQGRFDAESLASAIKSPAVPVEIEPEAEKSDPGQSLSLELDDGDLHAPPFPYEQQYFSPDLTISLRDGGMLSSSCIMAVIQAHDLPASPEVVLIDPNEVSKFDPRSDWNASSSASQKSVVGSTAASGIRRREQIQSARMILIPFHHGRSRLHWTLFVAEHSGHIWTIKYFDSDREHCLPEDVVQGISVIKAYMAWLVGQDFADGDLSFVEMVSFISLHLYLPDSRIITVLTSVVRNASNREPGAWTAVCTSLPAQSVCLQTTRLI